MQFLGDGGGLGLYEALGLVLFDAAFVHAGEAVMAESRDQPLADDLFDAIAGMRVFVGVPVEVVGGEVAEQGSGVERAGWENASAAGELQLLGLQDYARFLLLKGSKP